MKLLFIGDIVGRPGRRIIKTVLKDIVQSEGIELVIANGENAAGGFGLSAEVSRELLYAGIDVITLGNHTWDNREINQILEREARVVRPANYPPGTPGRGYYLARTVKGELVAVVNLLGIVFLEPLASPFETADELIAEITPQTNKIIVDFHGEATSEKMAMGWYLDKRVSAVLGTHTHIPTADERILPGGTGYITDVGMTGPLNSVLGIDPAIVIQKFLTKRPVRFEVASGPIELNAVLLTLNDAGFTEQIQRIRRRIEV